MTHQPSIAKAAFWMAGWLAAMLVMAIAGRETTRELDVFQIMEMRSVIGLVLLYPLIHVQDSLWADEELRNFRFLGRVACLYIARSLGAEMLPSLLDVDLAAAPPTIVAGGGPMDPVRTDVKAFIDALRRTGVRVTEKKYPVLMHGGLNFTAYSKTATKALQDVGELVRAEFAR